MSESTVIQPAAGQAILTTDTGHRGHNDRHHVDHGHCDTVDMANYRALTQQVERFGTLNGDRTTNGVQVTGDRVNTVGAAGALASGRTDQLVGAGFGGVHDRLCDAKAGIVNALDRGFTAGALAECKTQDAVALVDKNAVTLAKDNVIAMNVGFNAQTVQSERIGSAAQVLATAFANQAQNTATMYANAATVQVERIRAELALQAQANADAQALAMCKCCGEIQAQADRNLAAITATSVAGTQRILDRICDDKNADLRAQLVATQRLIAPTMPVGAG